MVDGKRAATTDEAPKEGVVDSTQEKSSNDRNFEQNNDNDRDDEAGTNHADATGQENSVATTPAAKEALSTTNNDNKIHVHVVSRESTPATTREASSTRSPQNRSLMSSIVIRRTEETLQVLQSDLQHASVELIRTLGDHLSQQENRSVGGISLPAAAVSWLASQSTLRLPTTQLTHLRITAETWPKQSSINRTSSTNPRSPRSTQNQDLQQQYASLQAFHKLRFNARMDITIFPSLQVLLLDQVPPDWILNLHKLQTTLQVLRVEWASLNDMEGFLFGTQDNSVCYSRLSHLKIVHCNLGDSTRGFISTDSQRVKAPLARLPQLCFLSLAHNKISSESTLLSSGISESPGLTKLDLSYNNIPSMVQAPLYVGNLKSLLLTGNQLQSAEGIDRLYSLQELALDKNNIRSWLEVKGLARLPQLKVLKLRGNPFMENSAGERKYVRVMLLDLFREQRWASSVNGTATTFRQLEFILPVIDGKPVSNRELKALQQRAFVLVSTRAREGERIGPSNPNGSDHQVETTSLSEGWTLITSGRAQGIRSRRKRKGVIATIEDKPTALRSGRGVQIPASLAQNVETGASPARSAPKREGRLRGPNVSFNIHDIILSLSPKKAKSTSETPVEVAERHGDDYGPRNKGSTPSPNGVKPHSNDDGEACGEFVWPQPLPYLPKENLYEEFVWRPPAAISLNEEKEKSTAARKQQKKETRKLKKKKPLAISTEEGDGASIKSSAVTSQRTKESKAGSLSPTKAKSRGATSSVSVTSGVSLQARKDIDKKMSNGAQEWTKAAETARAEETHIDELSASASLTGSHNQNGNDKLSVSSLNIRSVSFDDGDDDGLLSPNSATFPAMAMEAGGGDDITCSSMGTNASNVGSKMGALKGPNKQDKFSLAEIKSKWMGVEQERGLVVSSNLELYFQKFVFPDLVPSFDNGQLDEDTDTWQFVFFHYPRIQLLPKDRELRESCAAKRKLLEVQTAQIGEDGERLVKVWRENVVACGKPALRRLPPNRTAHFGFHGELSWQDGKVKTVSECRQVILCLSNTSLYVILDNDNLTEKEQKSTPRKAGLKDGVRKSAAVASPTNSRRNTRKFASPLPAEATFEQALWPHAVACHPLTDIVGITIGFGFQRMILRIRNSAYPSAVDYTYQLLTSNKMKTVTLLRDLQSLVKEVKMVMGHTTLADEPIKIDNDDRQFLDGLAAAVAPAPLGAVLDYSIVKQRWKHGQRGAVSRICVVTDAKIFLLDEDYVGDGSQSVGAEVGRRLGSPAFRLIDSADLNQIAEVKAADADPNAITIIIRPSQTLLRTHRWRLLCRDRSGAEKLVENVRKGMAMAE